MNSVVLSTQPVVSSLPSAEKLAETKKNLKSDETSEQRSVSSESANSVAKTQGANPDNIGKLYEIA